ncbi:MAG: pyridoxine 5'-phosphate synthase, partial [Flavobacteriales bacterium]|nr:pyridoxine 5'-phosphate synthase [Flavobacteriales bacterium]
AVFDLIPVISTEYNIEGNPTPEFIELTLKAFPTQVTLVPDAPSNITSNAGWNTVKNLDFLTEVTKKYHAQGIRVSIFVDPDKTMVEGAKKAGADRVELYTERFARLYGQGNKSSIIPYKEAGLYAKSIGLGLNAGHDLSLDNIEFFISELPFTDEVSIGHALISEALYLGLENTIGSYLNKIKRASL